MDQGRWVAISPFSLIFFLEDFAMHVLLTSRLTLRPPAPPDAEEIALHLSNWNVARMLSRVPFPYFVEDAEDWIEGLVEKPGDLVYTIHRERLIGVAAIHFAGGEPRLGYWLGEPWHGRGFMTEAAAALLSYAFTTRDIAAVRSSAFEENAASLRLQEKLGFTVAGGGLEWSRSRGETVAMLETRLTACAFAGAADPDARSAA
jgi:RimJ/RimL family protein N-acetyltransferase